MQGTRGGLVVRAVQHCDPQVGSRPLPGAAAVAAAMLLLLLLLLLVPRAGRACMATAKAQRAWAARLGCLSDWLTFLHAWRSSTRCGSGPCF